MTGTVYFGTVTDNNDPDKLGRVQVQLNDYGAELIMPWLRVLQAMATNEAGVYLLPEKDDQVLVLQGPGGVSGMIVIGALYNGKRKPNAEMPNADNNFKQFKTKQGNEITLDDTAGTEKITIQTIDSKVQILLENESTTLTLTGETEVKVLSTTKVFVEAETVEISGTSDVIVKGGSSVKIDGADVAIGGTSSVKITGMVEIG